jgi:hypothetical protein
MLSAGGQLLPVIGHVLYHALAHEIDEAAEWYDRAIAERDPFALIFPCHKWRTSCGSRLTGRGSPPGCSWRVPVPALQRRPCRVDDHRRW